MANNSQTRERVPASHPTPLVRVSAVEQHFGPTHALGPINVRIEPGEFVSIVGPSGCGKSTLLEIVAGLVRPSHGKVEVAGTPLEGPRTHTSIIFQDSATLPWRTVLDNVGFALEAQGVPKQQRRERSRELLDTVGLADFQEHYPSQLSGGMRQRVAIARALSKEPDLILADEPFGALDEQTRIIMAFELLKVVERLSCGVLFITHSIQEATLLSDRILVMSAGPGRILDEIHVPLTHPRQQDLLQQPEAVAIMDRVWKSIRSEAETAMKRAHHD